MPTFFTVACFALAAAAAFSTADAASLRTSNSKSLMSLLSMAHSKALKALTTKYDCDLGAANLVGTLKEVTSKNLAAEEALTKACADFQTGYKADLAAKLGEADTLANSAPAKGDAVYSTAEIVAHDAFKDIESKHEKLVADASSVAAAAATKQSLAQGEAALKHKEKDVARALFEAQTQSTNDAAEAEKNVLRAARDASIEAARGIMQETIKVAGERKKAADSACKSAFDTRMSLVTSDEHVVSSEIKPLLDQLRACNSVSAGGGSLLEVKAKATKTECKRAAREKLHHLQESLLQVSLNIAETPAKEVTGNMAEWESRLAKEKTFSENVRRACEEEASGILTSATAAARNVSDKAKNDANTLCSEEESQVDAATLAHLTPLQKIADDAEGPASAAEAALKIASEALEMATARRDAAEQLKISSITEAEQVKAKALEAAKNAKSATIASTMEAAETIRSNARADKEMKSTAKTDECDAGHTSLTEERDLVAQIKDKISTLTTVRDDETGEVDNCASKPCKNGGVCHDGVGSYTCECATGFSGDNCETEILKLVRAPQESFKIHFDYQTPTIYLKNEGFGGTITKFKYKCQIKEHYSGNLRRAGDAMNSDKISNFDDDAESVLGGGAVINLNLAQGKQWSKRLSVPAARYYGRDRADLNFCAFIFLVDDKVMYKYSQSMYTKNGDTDARNQRGSTGIVRQNGAPE